MKNRFSCPRACPCPCPKSAVFRLVSGKIFNGSSIFMLVAFCIFLILSTFAICFWCLQTQMRKRKVLSIKNLSKINSSKNGTSGRYERDKRICERIKAVLLADEGWTFQEIAKVLLLTDEAISQQIKDYLKSQKLKPENGGSVSKLNAKQTGLLIEHLQNHTYLYTKDIIAYVKATFGIAYTVPGITGWLNPSSVNVVANSECNS